MPSARSQHHRPDPGIQQYNPQPAAQLHAAYQCGERPHGLRLPRHDHCKSKEKAQLSLFVKRDASANKTALIAPSAPPIS